ncbi:MAG: hypothetical protein FDW93_04585 [Bergeyella sp.]|nr:hypothetical protein [Bergeyella sp.]
MNISHNFIIYYIDNVAYLYNYETKEEFEINKNYLRVLNNYTEETDTENSSDSEILEVLKENGMIKEDIDKPFVYLHYFSNIFHKISKDSSLTTLDSEEEWARQYLEVCKLTMDSAPIPVKDSHKDFAYVVDLPNPDVETYNVSLTDCLKKRKTIREFYDFKMPQQKLSDILYQSFGHIHGEEKEYLPFIRRSSPSGGCLQIVEPYVCVFNVESMENGVLLL